MTISRSNIEWLKFEFCAKMELVVQEDMIGNLHKVIYVNGNLRSARTWVGGLFNILENCCKYEN